jgi:hypothetical protein
MVFGILNQRTPAEEVFAGQSAFKGRMQTAGSHVLDLADLKKAIALCETCLSKFNHIQHGYVQKRNLPLCAGRCDGCDDPFPAMRLLVHHSLADNT